MRQALEAWGQQQTVVPLVLEQPGRTRQEPPRRWHGQRVVRRVEVEDSQAQVTLEAIRCVVVHSSQLAQQQRKAFAKAHGQEAERVTEHVRRVEARRCACAPDAEAAIADSTGRGQGRRGRKPRLWRSHMLHSRVEVSCHRQKRARRGRPPKTEVPQEVLSSRLVVEVNALPLPVEESGWTIVATTVGAEVCADTEMLQAYHDQNTTGEPGFRWLKHPAAISPGWLENPERMAALAMLTVVGLLVYPVIQRQVRLSRRDHEQPLPGNKGLTSLPTAAVILALCGAVTMVHLQVGAMDVLRIHGFQEHHGMICDALALDRSWYGVLTKPQNRPGNATPP